MSNLYVKYRPTEFSDMVGNELAIKALQKSLQKDNHSHVYMFTGPAGTGKTSLARIMAKHLGASELDIREYNSASNRGIDTAREIQQQMKLYPTAGEVIVYIIDEFHRVTSDFANALLKPLEDTPSHVYFFLCTTDPQKVIKPIKTRCTEVKLESLKVSELITLIHRVIKLDNLNISKKIYSRIAEVAEGCPRKALVILEQVASLESEEEQEFYLDSGTFSEEDVEIVQLCRKLLDIHANWQHIAKILKQLSADGKLDDAEKVRYAVLGYMNAVLLNGSMSDRVALAIEAFSEPTYNSGKAGITLACVKVMM
jgi:DNA polymerase-3 subunit gamma/tau